jgi:hypothetical protein
MSEDDREGRGAGEDSLARKDRTPRTGRAASGDAARATERMSEQRTGRRTKDAPAAEPIGTHSAPALTHRVQGPEAPATRLHFFFCCLQRSH